MRKKAILHIGASSLQINSIQWAKEMELYVIVTDMNKLAPGIAFADEYHNISGSDEDLLCKLAVEKNKHFEIIGVYGNSDFALLAISKIHTLLGLKGPLYNAVQTSLNKYKSKQQWIKDKVETPYAIKIKTPSEVNYDTLSYPIIVKPIDSCGSQGIVSVTNNIELLDAINNSFKYSSEILLEQFIDNAKHYDTIGVMWNGNFIPMGIGNRYFAEDPLHFPIWGHSPSDLSTQEIKEAYNLTKNAALSLNLDFTPIKADLIFKNGKFYVLEIAPRFHGDVFTSKMIPFSCNEKPIKNLFQLYKNQTLNSNILCNKKIIWKAIFPKKEFNLNSWLDNIEYKEKIYIRENFKFVHLDNTSLIGFIWFEVPENIDFSNYLKSINNYLNDYIL